MARSNVQACAEVVAVMVNVTLWMEEYVGDPLTTAMDVRSKTTPPDSAMVGVPAGPCTMTEAEPLPVQDTVITICVAPDFTLKL